MVTVCGAVLPERAGITATRGQQPEMRGCRWGNGPALCHPGQWLPRGQAKNHAGIGSDHGHREGFDERKPGATELCADSPLAYELQHQSVPYLWAFPEACVSSVRQGDEPGGRNVGCQHPHQRRW